MNPLAIASVAATIAAGGYHQPVIVPGQAQPPAARPISPATAAEVRELMRAAASPGGTPAARMAGINGGAKTGTSEVGQNAETTNGWFVLLLATASYHLQCHCDSRTPLYGQIAAMCTTLP